MATIKELQKKLDDKSIDPNKLSREQRQIIDELIKRGELKGPSMGQLKNQRDTAAQAIAREEEFYADPIAAALKAEDSMFKGRPTAELAGDLTGSIAPFVTMRKKIFGAAKNGTLWQKGPGKFLQSATKVADKLPGRWGKIVGGALKLVGRTADLPTKVWASPLGKAEIYSVLGGSAGAGAGSITYDMLNEQAGVTIANSITDAFRDMPQKEIDQDIVKNALEATKYAAMWNAGAAALTPFIIGPLGKGVGKLFGTKGEKAVRLSEYTNEKGLPLPLMTGIKDGVLTNLGTGYFKTVGVFPFVSPIGRRALQGAEQEASKQYLEGLVKYAPLMKTAALSSSIYNQAAKTFSDHAAVIGSKYQAFEKFAEAAGNPRVIGLDKTVKAARSMIDDYRQMFPDIPGYAQGIGDLDKKAIEKYLTDAGDPLNLFMKSVVAIGENGRITPKEYGGIMKMLNRAIEGSNLQIPKDMVWSLREALEVDLNSFGAKLTKDNFLKDDVLKEGYEQMVKQSGKEFADGDMAYKIGQGEQLYTKLKEANATFSSIMGFYTKQSLPSRLKKFDSNLFTGRGVNGILGKESIPRDQMFAAMSRDVFQSNSPDAIYQFKRIIGAEGPNATKNGKALYDAAKAKYMFNAFFSAFDSAGSPQAKSIFRDVAMDASVKSGNKYMADAMEEFGGAAQQRYRGFSIEDVRMNNGIYDVSKIRFGRDDIAQFNINKFMDNLGIGKATEDLGRDKMAALIGKGKPLDDFYKFTDYMKAISDIAVSDTSTFLQRRFTLSGGKGVLSGVVVGGAMGAVNPLAPLVFLLLAQKAGRMLTDPVALRYMNDALSVDEQLKILKGQKIRGQTYGRSIETGITSPSKFLTRAGLTQKREALARLWNYMADEDKDMPRIDPKTIDPIKIQEFLLSRGFENPKPIYDNNTLPKKTIEAMFAQDFTGSSGNVEKDNEIVDYIQSTARHEVESDADQESREVEAERVSVTEGMELENPVQGSPNTGQTGQQVNAQQFQALFPNDPTGAAIAQRGTRRA